jgi:RNA polymerase sigma factor (sigma-70 family)
MEDLRTDDLFRQLRSRDPREAWAWFLEFYSPLLFDVARRFESESEAVADCYLYICEQLSANGFRRLLRFRPEGPARFSTWLCAVARNLCLDWHRREFGRHRVFESVARMPALDQEIFRGLFVERLPIEDLFLKLEPRHPGLTIHQVAKHAAIVGQALSSRQRWLLTVRASRGAPPPTDAAERDEAELLRIPSKMPNPETWAGLQEERAALLGAMLRLPPRERLLIKLRFARELTLAEIAKLMGFDNPQVADRRIRDVVEKLGADMARIKQVRK